MFRLSSTQSKSVRPLALLVVAVLLVPALPVPPAVAQPSLGGLAPHPDTGGAIATSATKETLPGTPSQAYLDAMAHQSDAVSFPAGGRVTIPFRPKPGDTLGVDGAAPQPLPAGRLSGEEMRDGATGGPGDGTTAANAAERPPIAAGSASSARSPELGLPLPATSGEPAASDALAGTLKRSVIGFLPYWEVGSAVLDYNCLSTIAYFGVGVDSSGNLIRSGSGWSGWTGSGMTSVINAAHSKGTRVALTIEVFAWTTDQATVQKAILGSPTARQALAQQTAAAVRDRGADGVNLDFEPIVSGYGDDFTAFVRALRAELNKIKSGYELTIDVGGYTGNFELENLTATGMADALFIMGYDFRTAGSTPVGSVSPLTSSRIYDLTDSVNAYLARVPASKIVLGLPWYGRAWSTGTSKALNAPNMSGSTYGTSVTATYATARDLANANGYLYDTAENSAWTAYQGAAGVYGTSATWRELYYDDARSLAAKYDMVNATKLRGTGIWALGYDGSHPDLWKPIYDKFVTDITPPQAGIRVLPASQSQEAFSVSWTGDDDLSGVAKYDVQVAVDGGTWTAWLGGTKATSGTYFGTTHHGYAFRVRATDVSGNVGAWNIGNLYVASPALAPGGFGTVQVDGLNLRTGPRVSYSASHQLATGELLAIVGGPQSADGYVWYQVKGPITEWADVDGDTQTGWVAASGAGTWVTAAHAPNTTYVNSSLTGFSIGALSATAAGARTTIPIVGAVPTQPVIRWNLLSAADSVTLKIYNRDGSIRGSISLGAQAVGTHSYTWDGRLSGTTVAAGNYMIQVAANCGGVTYYSPAPPPFADPVWGIFGVQLRSNGRWAGPDRYTTAAAASAATYSPGVPVAFIASGEVFPDALTTSAIAGRKGGPVLLVTATSIPTATATELRRLKPASIVIVGGTASVSSSVATALQSYTTTKPVRWDGADRYAVAVTVSQKVFPTGTPSPSYVFLATGENFPDALAGSAAAAEKGGPVLLTPSAYLASVTFSEIQRLRPAHVVILGGTASVYPIIESQLVAYGKTHGFDVARWAGPDRVSGSAKISSNAFGVGVPVAFIVTPWTFPDAISAASSAARLGGPVLLVNPTVGVSKEVGDELRRLQPARIVVVGGPASVPDTILDALATYAVGS